MQCTEGGRSKAKSSVLRVYTWAGVGGKGGEGGSVKLVKI